MANNYEATVKLSNFIDSRIEELEDNDGNVEKCLVIPIEKNCLIVTKNNNVYCDIYINEKMRLSGDHNTHYLRQKLNRSNREKLEKLGYKPAYLGFASVSKFKTLFTTDNKFGYERRVRRIDEED